MQRFQLLSIQKQEEINRANSKLHQLNLFMNYNNAKNTQALKEEYERIKGEIEQGHMVVAGLQHSLQHQGRSLIAMEGNVDSLGEDVEQQAKRYDSLSLEVSEQKHDLTTAISDIESKLEQQQQLIRAQEQTLQRLLAVRFRMDFGVDCGIVMVAWYVTNLRLSTFFLKNCAAFILKLFRVPPGSTPKLMKYQRYRRMALILQATRMLVIGVLVRQLKVGAVNNGLHNLVGSYPTYVNQLTTFLLGKVGLSVPDSLSLDADSTVGGAARFLTSFLGGGGTVEAGVGVEWGPPPTPLEPGDA
jgi:hypothetical protein